MTTTLDLTSAAHRGASAFTVRSFGARWSHRPVVSGVMLLALAVSPAFAQSTYTNPGTVSTLAGGAKSGSTNGVGTAALFDNPVGVGSDAAGNIYVSDTFNHTLRKITPAG